MRRPDLIFVVFFAILNLSAFAQNKNAHFKMIGQDPKFTTVNETYSDTTEIDPFDTNMNKIYGLAVSAEIVSSNENSRVEFVFVDQNFNEYLIYEMHGYLNTEDTVQLENVCEETCILDGVRVKSVIINVQDAKVTLQKLHYVTRAEYSGNINDIRKELRQEQNADKIEQINKNIKARGQHWVAGPTSVAELSYSERKQLYGQSTFPAGFEFYAGGVISTESGSSSLKSATTSSPYVDEWDWRNRHGKNWISPVVNQGSCGSCWAFASTGAVEAITNVYFNQQLNLDLSEQDVLSCSNGGSCDGGWPYIALDYITNNGVCDENTFPYSASDLDCSAKASSPSEQIKISGRIPFGSTEYARTDDELKRMLIEKGPISGGLYDWAHAMVLVGYKIIKEGDYLYYRSPDLYYSYETIEAGDPLIGKLVWIFKNSWGKYHGVQGYVYVETDISNIGWTHAVKTPVISLVNDYEVKCTDADGDGYYWWGLGEKPANCPDCPDLPDGDDSDPTLGPLDAYGYCTPISPAVQPVADFTTSAASIYSGESVQFTDVSENTPTSWSWQFTGGTPSTSSEQNPSVTYNGTGTFQVSLTVTNAAGSDSKTMVDYITVTTAPVVVQAPVADFTSSSNEIEVGQSVSFTDVSTNSPTSRAWTFEGGSPTTSADSIQAVVYSTVGTFNVSLMVTNAGGSDTISSVITVVDTTQIPMADFVADQTIVSEGDEVSFTDKSQNNPSSWAWVFEGGTPATSSERNPKVTYNSASKYKVTLTVTNAAGNNTKTIVDYIEVDAVPEYCTPVADASDSWISKVAIGDDFYSSWAEGYTDNSITKAFELEAGVANSIQLVPDFSGRSSFNYWVVWIDLNSDFEFTDDEIVFSPSKSKSTVSGSILVPDTELTTRMRVAMGSAPITSSCPGAFIGEIEDYTVIISQPVPQPVADFAANVYSISTSESVQFSDISTYDPTGWQWSFSGPVEITSTLQNPTITFDEPGVYDVSLTVTKSGFESSTVTKSALITVTDPNNISYCEPVNINSSSDYIAGVTIGNALENQTSGNGYSFTSDQVNLIAGQSYDVLLTPSASTVRNFWKIWIDFNNDGIFNDTDEILLTENNKRGSVSSSITIPADASSSVRMRISMKSGKAAAACEDGFEGEVEDYIISFGSSIDAPQSASLISSAEEVEDEITLSVYPNPTTDMVQLKLSKLDDNGFYSVYSSSGVKIMEREIDENISRIDFSGQPSGMYILVVNSSNQRFTEKIIKK